jgi:calcium-dependent protein kinase
MISGDPPFFSTNIQELVDLIAMGDVKFEGNLSAKLLDPVWKTVQKDCVEFIKKMLTFNMDKRISASEALQEPWIANYTSKQITITDKELLLSLNRLRNFHVQTLFQTAVLSYITSQQMSKTEETRIRQVFNSFDKDNNGQVTKEELIDILLYIYGDCKRVYKEADQIFRNIDLDNNGTIEYNGNTSYYILEFLVANLKVNSMLGEENLKKAFDFYDVVS